LDPHGPAGPTAFWKVGNEIVDDGQPEVTLTHTHDHDLDDADDEEDEDYEEEEFITIIDVSGLLGQP
jgi:hypothetical protein